MSIFFDVLSAINNPNQQASVSQLGSIMSSVHNLATSYGIQPSQAQSMMSVVGNLIRPVLQQQQSTVGSGGLETLISQAVASGAGASALQALITPDLMQQFAPIIAQQTGMNPSLVQTALPTFISTVLSFLNMGAPKPGVWGSNSLLTAFLDGDRDGDADLGDVMKFANRFLNPAAA
jgi:predicted Kef-type K+ transport protein